MSIYKRKMTMDNTNSQSYIASPELFDFAAGQAGLLPPQGETTGRGEARRLSAAYREIKRCHEEISRRYGALPSPPAACEWLLDNYYMIEREYRAIYPTIDAARRLRRCEDDSLAGALCRSMLRSGGGKITEERFRLYMDGFQSVTVLRRAELTLIPAFLSAAVIEAVAEVCRELRYAYEMREFEPQFEALFGTLRLFAVLDLEKLISSADVTNAVLCADPSADYARMDTGTQQEYLRRVEELARNDGTEEHIYARRLIKKALEEDRHIGFYLFGEGEGAEAGRRQKRARLAGAYIGALVLVTLFITLLLGFRLESAWAAVLLFLPVSELVKSLTDFILLHLVKPRRLFRMDLKDGVPEAGRTICVVSSLLGGEADARRLEELYFACRSEGVNLAFGLLADLPGAQTESTEGDEAMIKPLREAVTALNRRYGARFYLFTRPRRFDGEGYSAHERKRGAIMELAKLLCDEESELSVVGEKDALKGMRYIITLDSDTRIYPGSAGELIGAMLHPMNRPLIDERLKLVTAGHAIIHPRIDTELRSASATDFSLIFAGGGGCDPYGSLCGELYMDAFDSGGFAGKGIIDAAALLKCTGDFPEGRILSHDAPEGAVLRGGYMGDVEFSDAFPAKPLAYYKRLNRWIRGDWQNLPFIFRRGLSDIERWRLVDSLRRSLIAPATLAAIAIGFFAPRGVLGVAAWAALLALLSRLFLSLAEGSMRRRSAPRLRRYTRILSGVGGAIVQTFIRLWLLPYEAWVSACAIATALWRMAVSHKRLLQWQTSAQVGGGTGLWEHLRAMYFPIALGAALIIFSPSVIGKSTGLMWLLSPAAAFALALPAHRESELSERESRYLIDVMKRSYGYFEAFHSADDNFLPPDNFQEQPPVGLARRTSPTNIGLTLAAHTAVCDMGLISRAECRARVGRIVDTLEKMPRHLGHYYNWYDTATLLPLLPAYISTVDSGNLYAGLLVTREAMADYADAELAGRISAIMAEMDFAPLYDSVRGLFHICYDTAKERGAGGWYDLMASEAMLTSYIAVSKGDVPVRHWRRLSRAQLQKDGYRGLASWTGTMFEYLMPELFLPVYRASLLYESARFCLYAQKRRVWAGKPWGISESAFYSLDSALNYRYKAHGCAALALKRGQDADMVVSPYSSFLALVIDPVGSIQNLRRLAEHGAEGRFGFIEALDFTPGRCRSERGEQVRCYMAHHEGMSVVAAANAAGGGLIQRRFMSAPEMAAHSLLLQERIDDGGVIIRREHSDVPERFERSAVMRWQLRGGEEDEARQCCVLSNGAYNLSLTNHGEARAECGGITIYDCAPDMGAPGGLELSISTGVEEQRLIPNPSPALWELDEESVSITGRANGIEHRCSVSTAYGDCGELRTVTLCAERDMRLSLTLRFKPILAPLTGFIDHPAFWELGIHAEATAGGLMLHRLRRGDCAELWICLAASEPMEVTADSKGRLGFLSKPYVSAAVDVELRAGQAQTLRFALCLSRDQVDCAEGAQRILVSGLNDRGNMVGASAAHLRMSGEEVGAAMELLGQIWPDRVQNAAAKREFWPYGISGEAPIICCDGRALECEALLKRFCLLKSCGINADLIYLSDEQGEYEQPVFSKISEALSRFGLEALIGAPGGVHFAPLSAASAVISRAAYAVGTQKKYPPALDFPGNTARGADCAIPEHSQLGQSFVFLVKSALPPRPWQSLVSSGLMGFAATECGIAYMWHENAREGRIDLPPRDILNGAYSEALWAESRGESISLFAADDGRACRVSFAPGLVCWEKEIGAKQIKTTVFIPHNSAARLIIIEGAAGFRLHWALRPVIGAQDAKAVKLGIEGRALTAENEESSIPGFKFSALCSLPCELGCSYAPPTMHMAIMADEVLVIACGSAGPDELRLLAEPSAAFAALDEVRGHWNSILRRCEVKSGYSPLDNYINFWCGYQVIACRLLARASLYQSGGALGFRDQLQDAVNIILLTPDHARERILDCCRHQYVEGDVMHWWHRHPEGDRGVRTRCSDDLLWLVWALCEYAEKTGDYALCAIECAYISSPPLADNERDRYETPETSVAVASVLDHAHAALNRCISRGFGARGLPYIGSGDWNDALDEVDGESVWLGWFFAHCASRFAALLDKLEKPGAARLRGYADAVSKAADAAWAGRWYARGYFADGRVLGGEGRIDSIAQSWAVLSGCAIASNRPGVAVDSALHRLVDRQNELVKLFDPPYSAEEPRPGYIVSYGEGFRENGGQYTHGAIWLAMACFRLGRADRGWEILSLLLPETHNAAVYGAEPFVLPADVYSAKGHEGEAGWTWYTGSAGWYFRAIYEEMLGLRLSGGKLTIRPHLPEALQNVSVFWTDGHGTRHEIAISRGSISVDGAPYDGGEIG